jgi:tryptophan 2,3-dioxygenase
LSTSKRKSRTAPAPNDHDAHGSDAIDYGSYLALGELLALQRARSVPEHPDELLFIVVHQASELWFKAILRELDQLTQGFERCDAGRALWHMQRLNALMRIVSSQLDALETLPPQHFAEFRRYLGASSGSQSIQFRAIEAASGLRDAHFMQAIEEHGPIPPLIMRYVERATLQDLFVRLLAREKTTLEELYVGAGPTLLFFLAEELLEYEQQFAQWRFKHVQLVERIIGPTTGGTGGTLGARYLQRTVGQRFFPMLWEVRGRFFGESTRGGA